MSGLKTTPDTRAEWRQGAEFRDFADDDMLLALLDDLDEALAAIECVCDSGLLRNEEFLEDHIADKLMLEGIPGNEFDAKWGDMSITQIVERLRAVLPPSKKEKLPDDACPDCRNGVHCMGCTSGCPCRSTCGKPEWDKMKARIGSGDAAPRNDD